MCRRVYFFAFKAEAEGRIHGVQICRRAPSISNLLFVDDSLIFCQANQEEVSLISDTLQLYAEASGQCINFEKSSAYFSSNTSESQRLWIKQALGVREVDRFETYLGLPLWLGGPSTKHLHILRNGFGKSFKGGKVECFLVLEKKYLLKQWPNQFQRIPWECSCYRQSFAMN